VLLGALALVCLALGIFFGYSWFFGGGKDGELPVVQAMDDPVKVKPENPGGLEVPYQDQLVLNQEGADGEGEPVVERLLPPPEAPQPPPREPATLAPLPRPSPAPAAPATGEIAVAAPRPDQSSQIVEAPMPDQSELVVVAPMSTGETSQVPAPPKPAKTQTAEALGTAPAKGSYVVQLGSFTSTAGSKQAWTRLQRAHRELLGDMSLFVQKAVVNDRTYFRVQAGPMPNRATAMDMCAQLKARKQDCLVVRR
jgi:cell division septation protein DedD